MILTRPKRLEYWVERFHISINPDDMPIGFQPQVAIAHLDKTKHINVLRLSVICPRRYKMIQSEELHQQYRADDQHITEILTVITSETVPNLYLVTTSESFLGLVQKALRDEEIQVSTIYARLTEHRPT